MKSVIEGLFLVMVVQFFALFWYLGLFYLAIWLIFR